jgi:hypothetical protein
MIKNIESIYWILLEKNPVIQKEYFLPSFCHGSGLKSVNPVCTSNLENLRLGEYGI